MRNLTPNKLKSKPPYFYGHMLQFRYSPPPTYFFYCEVTIPMHLQTGRLSLKAETLVGNIDDTKLVHAGLGTIKGVLEIRTSAVTGFIGIKYNPNRTSGYAILNYLIKERWIENILPFPKHKIRSANNVTATWVPSSLDRKPRQTNINRLAITAAKLVLPLIVGRYVGRSASRFVSSFL